jgi:hypothetical protein
MDIDGDGDVERRTLGVETILTTFCSGTAINSFDVANQASGSSFTPSQGHRRLYGSYMMLPSDSIVQEVRRDACMHRSKIRLLVV